MFFIATSPMRTPIPRLVCLVNETILFFLFTDGRNCQEIAESLNKQALLRRNGKLWTQKQAWAILSRDGLYRSGVVKYGKIEGRNDSLIILGK